ncbi:hypothetical protein TL16_g12961 [Triparma laevis f. inornata]|uniref:Uncharacterized protein n=1 Tax=Triparma laevis f. inornata TaxID=1714386 RepID=A0A9W7EYP1_9STRA|nr:hypothetical protein TL16_g12961 [Triparma laevis f. inornata]
MEPPLPPPKNTTPLKISKSLVGKEWEDKKKQRNEKLAKRLEEEEQKTLTFSPAINRYHLPDRTADDVLENMNRKEKLRQVRLSRLRDDAKKSEPNYTFSPAITLHSSTPLDGEPVLSRLQTEHETAMVELEKKKWIIKNFDGETGQKLFEPVINSGGDYGNMGWRSERNEEEEVDKTKETMNPMTPSQNILDVSEIDTFKDSVGSLDDDSNELARTLGTPPEPDSGLPSASGMYRETPSKGEMASQALYKDASDRKARLKDMLDYVEDVHKSRSAIGHLSVRSGKLAKKNMERKLYEAFLEMKNDEECDSINKSHVLAHLKKYKENGYINILLFMKEGEEGEEDMERVCGEMAEEIYGSFGGGKEGVKFPDFLRVASACCIGALSSGYSTKDEIDPTLATAATKNLKSSLQNETPVPVPGTSKSPVYMYPRKNRFKEDFGDKEDEEDTEPPPPPTPSSPANLSSLPYSKSTIYFCRASIRSITLNHTKKLLSQEESVQFPFQPELCAKSLEMDKRKQMGGGGTENRIDMMQVKRKMQEVKLKQKRVEKVKKETEDCTFRPEITKYKFQFSKKATVEDVFVDSSNGDEEEESQQQRQFEENEGSPAKIENEQVEQGLMPPKGIEGEEDPLAEIEAEREAERQQTVQFEEKEELLGVSQGGSKKSKPKPGHVVIRSVRFKSASPDNSLAAPAQTNPPSNPPAPLSPKSSSRGRTLSMESHGTNDTAGTSNASRHSIRGWDGPIEVADYLSQPAFDRLYNRRPHPERKEHKKNETEEERKLRECTFTPRINIGTRELVDRKKRRNTWFGTYESPEGKASWGKLTEVNHEKDGLIPKNFDKDIDRQKRANKLRNKARAFEENGGYTEDTWKAAKEKYDLEGVKPFSFQTGERQSERRETKLFMDVKLSKSKKGRIGICDFDKPRNLARTFARTYSLNKETEKKLTKVIRAYMEANDILVGGVNVRVTINSDGEEEEGKQQEEEWGDEGDGFMGGEEIVNRKVRAKTAGIIRTASSPARERTMTEKIELGEEGGEGEGATDFWGGGLRSRRASS